ncbi:N-6 DNA Methylase [uncultured archaeon]|nr:N-6 DNA Methylase [uncultured archaeon]
MADDGRMITKEEAKAELKKLIEFYNRNKDIYEKSSEQNIRQKLIDELFIILSWDLRGRESADEVTMEESISNEASKKKKSDYVFRLYGVPKFVVEAKAVKVNINSDEFREQAVGYSYNLACSWAVLTNFIQTRVYFVDKNDDTSIIRIEDISDLSKFNENFEQLWLLSKEAAKNNLLEERIKGMGIKPEKEKVFKQLFIDLKEWRGKLSNEIRRKYQNYQDYEIEEVVQRIIDRLIFIRKMEDLEIEERKLDQVARKINEGDDYVTYRQLKKVFEYYMEKYNSGLFGEEGKEQACDNIDIQDNVIKSVIQGMYTPTGRKVEYNFAAISGDVLGNIYEEYLSYILKVKENQKKTKLEGGRAHKKEQGIYYTPTYIVDYIVKNSVGEHIKNKSIDEILETKILDPACGSGSFLIRAFFEVCKTVEAKMKKGEKATKSVALKTYDKRLTLPQKTTILLSCIHGVDLDKKAVEIAQLNLFLKIMEGETAETISKLKNTKKILPMLNNNILVGNSLIDDEKVAGDLAFKWDERFKDIMARGGFNVVIGNPPYGYREIPTEEIKEAYSKKYETSEGNFDMYRFFIERSISILNKTGDLGFIIPNTFLTAKSYQKLRKYILNYCCIKEIVDLGLNVFEDVTIESTILILQKNMTKERDTNKLKVSICRSRSVPLSQPSEKYQICQDSFVDSRDNMFNINLSPDISQIANKIEMDSTPLEKIAYVTVGINTGYIKSALVSHEKIDERYHKLLSGRDISRYSLKWPGEWVLYDKAVVDSYGDKGRTLPDKKIFEEDKILVQRTRRGMKRKLICALDMKKFYNLNRLSNIVITDKTYSLRYCLGILNSTLMDFYFQKKFNEYEVKPAHLRQLPIKNLLKAEQQSIVQLVDKLLSFNSRLSDLGDKKTDERARIEDEIKKTDMEIDELVYKLYGITEEEKKVIEESLNER